MKQRPRHHVPSGKVSDDDGDFALYERKPKKAQSVQHYVEADVREGDTLQAIALRFNCTVALLKSVNSIHKENEIFAKGKLKIPVSAFSLFTETVPAVHRSGDNSPTKVKEILAAASPTGAGTSAVNPSDAQLQQKLIVAAVNSSEIRSEPSSHRVTLPEGSDVDDSSPLIPNAPAPSSVETVVLNEFTKGADFGIKWYHLLTFIAVLVVVPLIYVLYIAEHPEKYLEHHH